MRTNPCGLELFVMLGHDHVLRRNVRIAFKNASTNPFVAESYGSHHVSLCNHVAKSWNALTIRILRFNKGHPPLIRMAEMRIVESNERFGLVSSATMKMFDGLLKLEDADSEEDEAYLAGEVESTDDVLDKMAIKTTRALIAGPSSSCSHPVQTVAVTPVISEVTTSAASEDSPIAPSLPPSTEHRESSRERDSTSAIGSPKLEENSPEVIDLCKDVGRAPSAIVDLTLDDLAEGVQIVVSMEFPLSTLSLT